MKKPTFQQMQMQVAKLIKDRYQSVRTMGLIEYLSACNDGLPTDEEAKLMLIHGAMYGGKY